MKGMSLNKVLALSLIAGLLAVTVGCTDLNPSHLVGTWVNTVEGGDLFEMLYFAEDGTGRANGGVPFRWKVEHGKLHIVSDVKNDITPSQYHYKLLPNSELQLEAVRLVATYRRTM